MSDPLPKLDLFLLCTDYTILLHYDRVAKKYRLGVRGQDGWDGIEVPAKDEYFTFVAAGLVLRTTKSGMEVLEAIAEEGVGDFADRIKRGLSLQKPRLFDRAVNALLPPEESEEEKHRRETGHD